MTSALTFTVLAVLAVGAVALFNRLVRLRNRFENAFAQIDVQLRRRHDLVPNLVEAVRGSLTHERETLQGVVEARAGAVRAQQNARPGDATSIGALAGAETLLSGALGRLMAVVESYPTLQADAQVTGLREELTSTENRVAFARQAYNDAVTRFNTRTESFPDVIVARAFGFAPTALLEDAAPEIHVAPRVALA